VPHRSDFGTPCYLRPTAVGSALGSHLSRPHCVHCCYGPVTRDLPKGDLVDGLQDLGDFGHPRYPAIQTTGLLTFALAGLSPAEHTSLYRSQLPQGGFSPLRLEGWRIRRDLPGTSFSLSLLPAYAVRRPVCLRPSCFSVDPPKVGSVDAMYCTATRWNAPPTPGALAPVRVMLSRPSSLNRPHPPCSRAHRNFTARRLICDASAVRERLAAFSHTTFAQ